MTDETRDLNLRIDRRNRWKTAGSLVVAFAAFAALIFSATQYVTRAEQQEQRADQAQQGEQEAVVAVDQLCAQVRALGGVCVVDPADLRGDTGPPGPPPTDEQVQEAVNLFLLRNPPQPGRAPTMAEIADAVTLQLVADPPERGERGPGPRPEQIAGAVATFLLENPPPPGQPGADGEDGAPGADSTVPGPPGEPPLSWTFTTRDALGQPTTHRCVRDDPFDPDAPTYTCTEQEGL